MYTDIIDYIKVGLVCAGIYKGDVFVEKYDKEKQPGMVAAFIEFDEALFEANEKEIIISEDDDKSIRFYQTHEYELEGLLTIQARTLEEVDRKTDEFMQGFTLGYEDSNGIQISGSVKSSKLDEDLSELKEQYSIDILLDFRGKKGTLKTVGKLPFDDLERVFNLP